MSLAAWLVLTVLVASVSAWHAYWRGRLRGHLEGMDHGARAFQEGLDAGLARLDDRGETLPSPYRTGEKQPEEPIAEGCPSVCVDAKGGRRCDLVRGHLGSHLGLDGLQWNDRDYVRGPTGQLDAVPQRRKEPR